MKPRRAPTEPVPWRNTEAAAAYVGLGMDLFRAAVKAGEIAMIADGGAQRFFVRDLDAYLERKRQPAIWEREAPVTRGGRVVNLPTGINPVTQRPFGMTAAAPSSAGGEG